MKTTVDFTIMNPSAIENALESLYIEIEEAANSSDLKGIRDRFKDLRIVIDTLETEIIPKKAIRCNYCGEISFTNGEYCDHCLVKY